MILTIPGLKHPPLPMCQKIGGFCLFVESLFFNNFLCCFLQILMMYYATIFCMALFLPISRYEEVKMGSNVSPLVDVMESWRLFWYMFLNVSTGQIDSLLYEFSLLNHTSPIPSSLSLSLSYCNLIYNTCTL